MSKIDLLIEDSAPGLSAKVLFNYPNVYFDAETEVVAMLALTAPEVNTTTARPPLNIVAAIDCSTSMAGEKMDNAKTSLHKLVDHMGPDDRLCIIGFHSTVFEVLPSTLMGGTAKSDAHKKINTLRPNGWTNFSGALLQAFAEIKKVEGKKGCVNRIVLFTDGAPSAGVQDPAKLLEMLEKSMVPEISLTTFGYGTDVETELLSEMAKRGRGNFFYVKDIEKCAEMFGMELGGLLSTYAQNLKVTYTLSEGVSLVKMLDTTYEVDGSTVTIPDVFGGETKYLLLQVKLPKKTKAVTARPCRVVDFNVEYDQVTEARHRSLSEDGAINYVRQKEAVSAVPTPEVQAQVDLFSVAFAMNEAKVLADAGDFLRAKGRLESVRLSLGSHAYSTNLDSDLADLTRGLSSREAYTSSRADLIGTSHGYSTRRAGGSSRSVMFSTAAQNSTASAFVGADPAATPAAPGSDLDALWAANPDLARVFDPAIGGPDLRAPASPPVATPRSSR